MRVYLVDPSLYAPQYNDPLAEALAARVEVTLVGRPERRNQVRSAHPVVGHFYRASERARARSTLAGQVLKPFEHAVDAARLLRRLRRGDVDVLHMQWAVVPLLDAAWFRAAKRSRPVVFTVHDTRTLHGSGTWVQRSGMGAAIKAADALIVHTAHSRDVLVGAGIDATRIAIVPHGPVGARGVPTDRTDGLVRILQYGKIRPYKGVDLLLDAVAALPVPVRERVRVTIAGDPLMDVQPLVDRARTLGIGDLVEWELGYISDERTWELLAAHDVMALPYDDIDSSGVLALAQTWPMPVVASRVGGFAEQLAGNRGALLFDVRDVAGLAARLGQLTEPGQLAALRTGAEADAAHVPTWAEAADQTVAVYERLLAARGA